MDGRTFLVLVGVAFFAAFAFQSVWILGTGLGLALLVGLLTEQAQLYDARSGIALQRKTVAGAEYGLRVMKKGELLSIPLRPVRPLHHPLSIVAIIRPPNTLEGDHFWAANVFRSALLNLLLNDLIEVQPITLLMPGTGHYLHLVRVEYVIVKKSGAWPHPRVGGLEGDILRTIADGDWKESGEHAWLGGPRVYDLVRAYFEKDLTDPYGHILQSVDEHAAALGLCRIERAGLLRSRKAIWDESCIAGLRADRQIADQLALQFRSMCPDVWEGLLSQISEGIKSRVDNSD